MSRALPARPRARPAGRSSTFNRAAAWAYASPLRHRPGEWSSSALKPGLLLAELLGRDPGRPARRTDQFEVAAEVVQRQVEVAHVAVQLAQAQVGLGEARLEGKGLVQRRARLHTSQVG
jgi:hypothetical protein